MDSKNLIVSLPENNINSRVEFTDGLSGVSLNWEDGDMFSVYSENGVRVADYQFCNSITDNTVIFALVDGSESLTDGETYTAIYPTVEDVETLEEHRTELENRLTEQTQTGNSDNHHLNDALRMEANFTYNATSDTKVLFEHKMATIRLTFETIASSLPTKVTFNDGSFMSYSLNLKETTEADTYNANFVIKPNESGINRTLEFTIYNDKDITNSFSVETEAVYSAGVQYRSELTTSDISITITNKQELIAFRDMVNNDGNSGINAFLKDNIDLSGEEWTPIGDGGTSSYSGKFDGGDYTISNLTINGTKNYQGLFGYVKDAEISNLTIKNPQIKGNRNIGAICGYGYNSSIKNCNVKEGYISGSENCVGGIAGYIYYCNEFFDNFIEFNNCQNINTSVSGIAEVGGLIGYADYIFTSEYPLSSYNSKVENCINSGKVSGIDSGIGGIIGYANNIIISNCHNTESVTGTDDRGIGGIIGFIDSESVINSCYNTGKISGDKHYVGGISGYVSDLSTISSCYNTGQVSSKGSGAGGLFGYITSHSSITNCYNTGEVSGNLYSGGIVGQGGYFNMSSCYSTGLITASDYTGGIIGFTFSTADNCYYLLHNNVTYTNDYGGTSLSDAEMKSEDLVMSLNGTSVVDYWTLDSNNSNNGYPILIY